MLNLSLKCQSNWGSVLTLARGHLLLGSLPRLFSLLRFLGLLLEGLALVEIVLEEGGLLAGVGDRRGRPPSGNSRARRGAPTCSDEDTSCSTASRRTLNSYAWRSWSCPARWRRTWRSRSTRTPPSPRRSGCAYVCFSWPWHLRKPIVEIKRKRSISKYLLEALTWLQDNFSDFSKLL